MGVCLTVIIVLEVVSPTHVGRYNVGDDKNVDNVQVSVRSKEDYATVNIIIQIIDAYVKTKKVLRLLEAGGL